MSNSERRLASLFTCEVKLMYATLALIVTAPFLIFGFDVASATPRNLSALGFVMLMCPSPMGIWAIETRNELVKCTLGMLLPIIAIAGLGILIWNSAPH